MAATATKTKKSRTRDIVLKTQAEVAVWFAVSQQMVSGWIKDGMPGRSSRYPVRPILLWLRKDGPWKRGTAQTGLDADLKTEKILMARQERLAGAGDLLLASDVARRWEVTASRLRQLEASMAGEFGQQAAAMVRDSVISILGACPRIRSDLDLPGLMRY